MTLVLWGWGSDMAVFGLDVMPYVCLKTGMYLTFTGQMSSVMASTQ